MNTTKNTRTIGNVTVRFTRWTFGPEVRLFGDAALARMIREAEEAANRAAMESRASVSVAIDAGVCACSTCAARMAA